MFEYTCSQHKDTVTEINADVILTKYDASFIKNINLNEIVICFLSAQHNSAAIHVNNSLASHIHLLQLKYLHSIFMPLQINMSDAEYDYLGDCYNIALNRIRTFNNSFISYYNVSSHKLENYKCDFLNLLIWTYAICNEFSLINYKIIQKAASKNESLLGSLAVHGLIRKYLKSNLEDFEKRHQVTNIKEIFIFYTECNKLIDEYVTQGRKDISNFISEQKMPFLPNFTFCYDNNKV